MTVAEPDREPLRFTAAERAEEEQFVSLYGAWEALDPAGAASLLTGFERPWWIVGGWAVEAFTGHRREHEDLDVSVLSCDVEALRRHLRGRLHVWSNDGGTLRPLTDRDPEPLARESQLWLRRDATSPWLLDVPLTPDADGQWRNKRDPDDVRPLDEATWVASDGLRYLRPELVLLHKARLDRPKDRDDLARVWPLLDPGPRQWLRSTVDRLHPGHPWSSLLTDPA